MNFKNLAMWAIIVFLTMGLYNLFKNPQNTSSQNNNITFSKFLEEVDNGRVVQVNIQGNSIKGVYSNGKNFNTYSPNDPNLIKKRAELVKSNEKFSQNILTVLREIAEEKEQLKSQEDIYAEESIYKKFTTKEDNAVMPAFHRADWKEKFLVLQKFKDERLRYFGKKILYEEHPESLPKDEYNNIHKF